MSDKKEAIRPTKAHKAVRIGFIICCLAMVVFSIRGAMGYRLPDVVFPIMGAALVLAVANLVMTLNAQKKQRGEKDAIQK